MAVFDKFTGIGVASGFKLQAKVPLDARLVVDSIADRDALITENGAYEGRVVYVKATKKRYQLDGTTTSDWTEIDGASGETAHTHENKEVLDAITQEKVAAWDGKPDVYIQASQPENMKENDIWIQISE